MLTFMLKKVVPAAGLTCLLAILGCGVIRTEHKIEAHITLDIRHVEQQVDDIFDFVEGETDALPAAAPEPTGFLEQALDWLDPCAPAYAQEEDSSQLREIATRLRERHDQVTKWKQKGCVGENNRGYLALRESPALAEADTKNEVQQMLADENKDRKALYNELARVNKESGATVATMERLGAKNKLKRATKGEWVQLPSAGEDFDAVKAGALGEKLGSACVPDAWVQMP